MSRPAGGYKRRARPSSDARACCLISRSIEMRLRNSCNSEAVMRLMGISGWRGLGELEFGQSLLKDGFGNVVRIGGGGCAGNDPQTGRFEPRLSLFDATYQFVRDRRPVGRIVLDGERPDSLGSSSRRCWPDNAHGRRYQRHRE